MNRPTRTPAFLAALVLSVPLGGCSDRSSSSEPEANPSAVRSSTAAESARSGDGLVEIGDGRQLFVRCTGTGSPTVIMEGGDGDTSDSFAFAEAAVAGVTRTCVYDRANLGNSDPDPGPRGLDELVGDLESLIRAAAIPGPYVLVGVSGGGYIVAGYAARHPEQVAGMVLVEVTAPWPDPPKELLSIARWNNQ